MLTSSLRAHDHWRAVVLHRLVGRGDDLDAGAMVGSHPNDVERSARGHNAVAPRSSANRQLLGGFVPGEGDQRVLPSLIVIAVALIFIEHEGPVLTLVDADLQRVDALC